MAPSSAADASERTPLLSAPAKALQRPRKSVIIACLWLGSFLFAVDASITMTLAVPIGSTFGAAQLAPSIGSVYLAGSAAASPLWGKLSDIVGRRAAVVSAVSLFTVCIAGCALSGSMQVLLIFRLFGGIGGCGVFASTTTIMGDLVSQRERGLFQGISMAIFAVGSASGPIIGGLTNDAAGWRAVFGAQIPLLLVQIAALATFVDIPLPFEDRTLTSWQRLKQIDWLGSVLSLVGIGSIVAALQSAGNTVPWSHWTVITELVVGAIAMAAFLYVEARVAARPIIALDILFTRTIGAVIVAQLCQSIVILTGYYETPYIYLVLLGLSPSEAGPFYVPISVGLAVGGLIGGALCRKTGRYQPTTTIASAMMIVTPLVIAFDWLPHYQQRATYDWRYFVGTIPLSLGRAGCQAGLLLASIAAVDYSQMASTMSINTFGVTFGQVLGISFSASIVQESVRRSLLRSLAGRADAVELADRIRTDIGVIQALPPDIKAIALEAFRGALRTCFLAAAGVAMVATLACALIPSHKLGEKAPIDQRERASDEEGS